ncbi:hypothetical protein JG687_00005570 [Phytophthora cactorum]|uniref:Uncharacterized protein n=1 Tax=Phytophthora cactorum TaxID=29920 RepID=A0A8T1UKJ0_9STRA|nr:hypothetical protein JG687_00005570 [Phytophthora cactorum]
MKDTRRDSEVLTAKPWRASCVTSILSCWRGTFMVRRTRMQPMSPCSGCSGASRIATGSCSELPVVSREKLVTLLLYSTTSQRRLWKH